MVRFTKEGFTIEYNAASPVEEWLGLMEDISFVFSSLQPEQMPKEGLWRLANLIEAMMPDYDTAKKMLNN